jgi:hypothetical protein
VRFKLGNDSALTQKVSLAVADMALDVAEAIEKQRPLLLHPFWRGVMGAAVEPRSARSGMVGPGGLEPPTKRL